MAPFTLVQLPQDTSNDLYTDKDLGFCWAAFCCGREKDAYRSFAKFREIPIFQKYFERLPAREREIVGRYLGLCVDRDRYNLGKIVNLVITNEKEKEKFMYSVAQEFIDQGIQQGIQQGVQQGRQEDILAKAREVARNMLLKFRLDLDTVQKVTELSKGELQDILKENHTTSKRK
jgi:hypothetical protein